MTPTWQINVGDCRDLLAALPAEHFHCVVTSPPYWGLRSYLPDGHADKRREIGSEATPDEFVATMVEVFRGVRRVLRDDGVCWVNLGDSYGEAGNLVGIPWRVALALQADGWILRADDIWHKASPMPESVRGWRWEKCRVKVGGGWTKETHPGYSDVDAGKSRSAAYGLNGGTVPGPGAAQYAPCPGCRKCEPNGGLVLRRGSWRRTRAHEYVFMLVKTGDYFADGEAVAEPAVCGSNGSDTKTRNPRSVLNADGQVVLTESEYRDLLIAAGEIEPDDNPRSVVTLSHEPYSEAHFATFPSELVRPLLLASTSEKGCCPACGAQYARITERRQITRERPNDFVKRTGAEGTGNSCANTVDGVETVTLGWRATCGCDAGQPVPARVLDPFNGSGTTGMVARRLGLHYVGLELFEEYAEMARKRIKDDNPLLNAI